MSEGAKPSRVYVVADVGGADDYHLGDEAMLEANLATLRRLVPGIAFTSPSRDPAWTSRRYGVDAVAAPTFAPEEIGALECWERERPPLAGLAECDALLVSGGGNLCATWPAKILERVAPMAEAQARGLPIVLVGQTLGPELAGPHRRLLASVLPSAAWLGVRDPASAALAVEIGVPADRVHLQLDDAFFMTPEPPDDAALAALRDGPRPWIVVTLDASFAAEGNARLLAAVAGQLDALAGRLRATVVFSPHVGGERIAADHQDSAVGRALAASLYAPVVVLDLWQPRAVRWLIAQAAMVVSSRYHPVVFATAAGVPVLAIHQDAYTRTKLMGALARAELTGWCLSTREAARGDLLPLAAELWHRRGSVVRRMARAHADAWPDEVARWEGVVAALRVPAPAPHALAEPDRLVVEFPATREEPADRIGDAQWREYDRQGYLRLGRVLDAAGFRALGERLDAIMLGEVRHPSLQFQLDTGGAYEALALPTAGLQEATLGYRKIQGLEVDPLVLDLLRHDLFREICAHHYGKHASISIFRAMMMNKPAGQGTYLPWHQDGGDVWKLDRDPLVTIWVAIDPATRANGCLEIVPGSHRLGLLSTYGSTISDADAARHCPDEAIVPLEVEPGEALLLHNWLIHRSGLNATATPRRAFTACYMDGRTVGTLTGTRYPIVFGEHEDTETALPFLRAMLDENRRLTEARAEAERYATSLEVERASVERYAKSLEAERAKAASPSPPQPSSRRARWWRSRA